MFMFCYKKWDLLNLDGDKSISKIIYAPKMSEGSR
jgi:hypothetical protein